MATFISTLIAQLNQPSNFHHVKRSPRFDHVIYYSNDIFVYPLQILSIYNSSENLPKTFKGNEILCINGAGFSFRSMFLSDYLRFAQFVCSVLRAIHPVGYSRGETKSPVIPGNIIPCAQLGNARDIISQLFLAFHLCNHLLCALRNHAAPEILCAIY